MKKKHKKEQKGKAHRGANLKNRASRERASAAAKRAQAKRAQEHAAVAIEPSRPERVSGILISLRSLDARELPRRIPKGSAYRLYLSGKEDDLEIFVPEFDPSVDRVKYREGLKVGVTPDYKTESRVCIRMGRHVTVEHTLLGKVDEVFGEADDFEANYREIIYKHGVRTAFPSEVEREADARAAIPLSIEGRSRPDRTIFTIDGEGARDLDDAISISKEGDCFRLGVHIADVSTYVLPDSHLMEEAIRRTCSTYFPREVFPMLPRALSNAACSLNAGEDKYALSVYMDIDERGRILSTDIRREIINSSVRGVYSEVNDLFTFGARSEFTSKYASVADSLKIMKRLYKILVSAAQARGSVELDMPEAVIIPSGEGEAPKILREERGDAERMIEQFMLCANTAVAAYFIEHKLPCVYRVHESPDPVRLSDLALFARSLGISPDRASGGRARTMICALLRKAEVAGLSETLSYPILRAMAKAKYSERNLGHFALALTEYCHFTSPIRRLSDLAVHTVLSKHLQGENAHALDAFARKCAYEATEGEFRSVAAEREISSLYCAYWMSFHVGEEFEAKVSSVTRFGLFVTLPNTCEGLIPISTLDGYFNFDESTLTLKKEGGAESYRLGDILRVKLEDVSISSRRASFSVSEKL